MRVEKMMSSKDNGQLSVYLAYRNNVDRYDSSPYQSLLCQYLKKQNIILLEHSKEIVKADIVLLISLNLLSKVKAKTKDRRIPIVCMPFVDHKNFMIKKGKISIGNLKCINEVDQIVVETKGQKDFLEKNGVKAPIQIVTSSTPVDQRNTLSEVEKNSFKRYFGIRQAYDSILIIGSPSTFKIGESLARMMPESVFVFIDITNGSHKKRWITEKVPNLYYEIGIRDELYSSAIACSSAMIILDDWVMDLVVALDCIASYVPLFACNLPLLDDIIQPGADYEKVESTPFDIYEKVMKVRKGNSIADIALMDLTNKINSSKTKTLVDAMKDKIASHNAIN